MRCGVGDYCRNLAVALSSSGTEVGVYTSVGAAGEVSASNVRVFPIMPAWSIMRVLGSFGNLRRMCAEMRFDWVNIQYPAQGYSYSLGPQLLALFVRMFIQVRLLVTIHEFRHARFLRRLSIIPFLLAADRLIFTSEEEAAAVLRSLSWFSGFLKSKYSIVPVGSNVPVIPRRGIRDPFGYVVFFGLFYPGRQLELVSEVFASIARRNDKVKFRIIGDVHPKYVGYYQEMASMFGKAVPGDRLEWHIGRTPWEIGELLSSGTVAILPYPGGASFRRTTMIAAMLSGIPVVSTKGVDTPIQLKDPDNIFFASTVDQFADRALSILSSPEKYEMMSTQVVKVVEPLSWENISNLYLRALEQEDA